MSPFSARRSGSNSKPGASDEPPGVTDDGIIQAVAAHSFLDEERARSLLAIARQLDDEGVAGNFVELGVARGGSAGLLGLAARRSPIPRRVWLFDSFEGLPEPTERDGAEAAAYAGPRRAGGQLLTIERCVGTLDTVRTFLLDALRLPAQTFEFVPGWFQDMLPTFDAPPIALLHIDADWYDSVRLCLDRLYDHVVPAGYVVLDDYGYWEGCRKAFHEFAAERALDVSLVRVGSCQAYTRKGRSPLPPPIDRGVAIRTKVVDALRLFGPERVMFYGAGREFAALCEAGYLDGRSTLGVIDDDPSRWGAERGHDAPLVIAPEAARSLRPAVIVVTASGCWDRIYRQAVELAATMPHRVEVW